MDKYLQSNRILWNAWTDLHIKSTYYDVEGFKAGKSSLKDIELAELGDVAGKSLSSTPPMARCSGCRICSAGQR